MGQRRRRHARFIRRALRRRWWVAATIFLCSCSGVGVMLWTSPAGASYRSTAFVRVANPAAHAPTSRPIGTAIRPDDLVRLALAPATRRAALLAAALPADDAKVSFDARLSGEGDVVALTATAPTPAEAETVARAWADAFGGAHGGGSAPILDASRVLA